MRLIDWVIKMNSDFLRAENYNGDPNVLERRAQLIVVGINLATQIKRTVKSLIMIHEATRASLPNERLKDIL
jgi:hypothetical protein